MKEGGSSKVNTRIWKFHDNKEFAFPEESIDSIVKIGNNSQSIGLAFSGGGTRSASCTIGYLAGLKKAELLPKVKYISAVSGGAWASIPFTFLPDNFDEDSFLGKYFEPGDLNKTNLNSIGKSSFQYVISDSKIILKAIGMWGRLSGDETYAKALGGVFLKPFDLDDNNKFLTHDQQTLQEAIDINPELNKTNFYCTRPDRPFFIATSTILDNEIFKKTKKVQVEFTPYYCGVRTYHSSNEPIGGGYINTYAYDSSEPLEKEDDLNKTEVQISKRWISKVNEFSLSDLMGCTGAAPEETLNKLKLRNIGFPEFKHWSVIPDSDGEYERDKEFPHGDGGHLENLGVMPLLARKVENIIVFVNSLTSFKYDKNEPIKSRIDGAVRDLFISGSNSVVGKKGGENIVFKDGEKKFLELLKCFNDKIIDHEKRIAKEPLVVMDTYEVEGNSFYSIAPYSSVKIVWVYNNRVQDWEDQLHDDYKRKIGKIGGLKHFPNYWTFGENFPYIIDLSLEDVGLLSNFTYWIIRQKSDDIKSFFNI